MYENRYNKQLQEAFEAGYRKALNEQGLLNQEVGPYYWNKRPGPGWYWVKGIGWVNPDGIPGPIDVTFPGQDDPIWGGVGHWDFSDQPLRNPKIPLAPNP